MTSNHLTVRIEHQSGIVEFSIVRFGYATNKVNVEFLGQPGHVLCRRTVDRFAGLLERAFVRLIEVIEAFLDGNHSWMIFGDGLFNHFRQVLQCLGETWFGVELNQSDSKC